MIFLAGNSSSKEVELGSPVSVELRRDEDAPADSLSAVFPLTGELGALERLSALQGDTPVFDGIVDEQRVILDASGRFVRLEARSRTALLLDNEALPQQYERPSLPLLFGRHAAPYGITRVSGNSAVFSGRLSVTKGMSEWAVLSKFCDIYLGVLPRITPLGELDATGKAPGGILFFSPWGGIPYCSIEETMLPCELLSEVWVRADSQGEYGIRVADQDAIARGVRRRRYVNAAPGTARPASFGEGMVRKARRKSYRLTLVCPGWVDAQIGQAARVDIPLLETAGELQVCALWYRLGQEGRLTTVTLRAREE